MYIQYPCVCVGRIQEDRDYTVHREGKTGKMDITLLLPEYHV